MKTASQKRRRSRRSPPKISAVETTAVRIMRKLYKATGGQPQRWESLDDLGAVASDAAGIAYAVERDWLIISGGLHSVSFAEGGDNGCRQSGTARIDPRRSHRHPLRPRGASRS
jgi:hypothetical protein